MTAGRPPGRPRLTPAAPLEPPAVDTAPDEPEALEPEDLVNAALEGHVSLTPEVVRALNEEWRNVVQGDDEFSKNRARRIVGVLRRAKHQQLHAGGQCVRVTIDVPLLPNKVFVRINERPYFGTVEVWECEARTILELVHRARVVEAERNSDRKGDAVTMDLDSPLAERARAIQRA